MRIPKLSIKAILLCMAMVLLIEMLPASLNSREVTPLALAAVEPGRQNEPIGIEESKPGGGRITTSVKRNPAVITETTPETGFIPEMGDIKRPSLITQGMMLTLLSMLPFMIMTLTSFLKIVIVLSLLRTALGVQQAPPNQVINGVAFLLSLFIMYPTALKMYDAAQDVMKQNQVPESFLSHSSSAYVIQVANAAGGPMKDFLKRNSTSRHQALFYRLIYKGLPEQHRASLKPDDFMILVPSYITGQLQDAFEIGVLIYIPFFVIDLVTSNILLAMGMMMLSPVTISMPLKLFLLVMLDGWTILIEGLVKTFQ
jgi:type III secretion protein R